MESHVTEIQQELLATIARENGLTNFEVEEISGSKKGDNYLGFISGITIKDKKKKLELIAKLCPQDELFRKSLPLRNIFLKEIRMYENILENFLEFQNQIGMENPFKSYPKFYGKCESEFNECLVLENLVKSGFSHWNRKIPMNSKHISMVMSSFGRFHAISFAMKKRNSKRFDDLTSFLKRSSTEHDRVFLDNFLKSAIPTIQLAIRGNIELEDAFNHFIPKISQFFMKDLREDEDLMVITHGDSWCNNIMFKYDDPTDEAAPSEVCFIDWQMSRYSSLITDLAYFFCSSSSKEILEDYKKYLKIYHESLSKHLVDMSCDPQELFPFEKLEYLWSKSAKFGLIMGSFLLKALLIDSENAANIQDTTKGFDDFFGRFETTGIEEKLNHRIADLCNFMVENNFI